MRRVLLSLLLIVSSVPALWSAPGLRWEEVNDSAARSFIHMNPETKIPGEEEGVEIFARDGYIYISTDHDIPVRVISILGQLIGEGNLHPGVYRMPMKSRGIYIIKAGMATVRVTL